MAERRVVRGGLPAHLACAGTDQAGGWLAALGTIGTLAAAGPAYVSARLAGLVTDARGAPMSQQRGNVLAPLPVLESIGADALRWFFCGGDRAGPPDEAALRAIVSRVLVPYWASASFLADSARANPESVRWRISAPAVRSRPVLDRWLLSELHALVRDVTRALEAFDLATTARRIAAFVDGLHWYVGQSGPRFAPGRAGPRRTGPRRTRRRPERLSRSAWGRSPGC